MVPSGEREPTRRFPTRVRQSSIYATSPANKGKSTPTKVKPRSPEVIEDRRGNFHDPASGRFTEKPGKKATQSAPADAPTTRTARADAPGGRVGRDADMSGVPNSGRPSQPESGRSSPETLASFSTVTSASILRAHLAARDTDE